MNVMLKMALCDVLDDCDFLDNFSCKCNEKVHWCPAVYIDCLVNVECILMSLHSNV
jgi:hypothetical protein